MLPGNVQHQPPHSLVASALPVHRLTLNFLSPEREAAYRHAQFVLSLKSFRWALAGCVLIHLLYLYVDVLVLVGGAHKMWMVRLLILIPVLSTLLAFSFHKRFEPMSQSIVVAVVYLNSAAMSVGHALYGAGSTMYFVAGTVMVIMVGFVLIGLRFAYAVPVFVLTLVTHVTTIFLLQLPANITVVSIEVLVFSASILSFGAYRLEISSRKEHYIAEQLLTQERREREWLGLVAGFVRHELKNSVAGIGSSLQLIASTDIDERRTEYVGRATRSLQFMRRFLDQVAAATNLEGALRQQDLDAVSLSELVAACIDDIRQVESNRTVRAQIATNLRILGNADSLAQMVDKLLNNALEHSTAASVIEVNLTAVDGKAILDVSNRGDRLPDDPERLFKPFVSSKQNSAGGNLGLGLYVAQTIVTHHGGQIFVLPLTDPAGARFVVSLPLATKNER